MACAYCITDDHDTEDHHDPVRAAAVAARLEQAGDPSSGAWYRLSTTAKPRRRDVRIATGEEIAAALPSPIESAYLLALLAVLDELGLPHGVSAPPGLRIYATKPNSIRIFCQETIGAYTVDFLILAGRRQVIIECDGHAFHEKTKEQAANDAARTRELHEGGRYIVLRFTGSEIHHDARKCAAQTISIAQGEKT